MPWLYQQQDPQHADDDETTVTHSDALLPEEREEEEPGYDAGDVPQARGQGCGEEGDGDVESDPVTEDEQQVQGRDRNLISLDQRELAGYHKPYRVQDQGNYIPEDVQLKVLDASHQDPGKKKHLAYSGLQSYMKLIL